MTDIPAGFAPLRLNMGLLEVLGPLYGKWAEDRLVLGFRVERRHCNPAQVAHGGMLATFADMLLPIAARFHSKAELGFLPTVNLTCDYLAPAPLGSWVEGRADLVKTTRNLLFAQGLATADGEPVLRANGIFKISSVGKAADFTFAALFGQTT
jgi:uncharacterized protein (TIGR00369 family)